jgi:hypothetical protein
MYNLVMPEKRLSLPFLLVSTLLVIALGVWVLAEGLHRTVGQSEQAKKLIHESGLYQAIIPSQVADVQKANPSLAGVPLDHPEIQKILASSLDSKKLEQEGDKAIDAVYAWLEGKNDKPLIDITVFADQQRLATAAGDYVAKHLSSLPACAPSEADYAAFSADPLSASCLPPGTSPEVVKATVQNTIATNPALGTSTQLTEKDVKLTNGKTIMDSFNTAPVWYQRAQMLPLIALITAAACIVLLLLILRPTGGIKSAGKHLLSVGITFALVAIGLAWALEKSFSTFLPKSDNPNVGDALMKLTTLFNNALRDNMVLLSLYMVGVGAVLLVLAFILRHLPHAHRATPASATNTTSSNALSAAAPKTSFAPAATKTPAPAKKTPKKKTTTNRKKK